LTTWIDHRRTGGLPIRRPAAGLRRQRNRINSGSINSFAEKVLDDARPTERPARDSSSLAGAGIAVLFFRTSLLFTCQRAA